MERTVFDMTGREVHLKHPPRKIISLVPSLTELLHYLHLEEQVAGITRFCIKPEHWSRNKIIVGGTKTVDLDRVRRISPDLIIGNKEENVLEQIEKMEIDYPVWISDVNSLDDALRMITGIGEITFREKESQELSIKVSSLFAELEKKNKEIHKATVAYLIWKSPYMVAGKDTFINHLLERCGLKNSFSDLSRYPEVTLEELRMRNPDFIFFSSEPFPFNEKRIEEERENFPDSECMLVDGEYFSWYGSRLLHVPDYLSELMGHIRKKNIF
ncbi:MAG: helical backbone metal receptor [Bacteroidota bacterium]